MITTDELESSIGNIWESRSSLTDFCKRLATSFKAELAKSEVTFVAVNDGEKPVGAEGFDHPFGADLTKTPDGNAVWNVRDGMAFSGNPDKSDKPKILSSMTDSEISEVSHDLAIETVKIGKRVAFCNLYCPKAIEFAQNYNDLEVAFRCVRAWDAIRSVYLVRVDFCCKKLDC